jgi:hypothetical protein
LEPTPKFFSKLRIGNLGPRFNRIVDQGEIGPSAYNRPTNSSSKVFAVAGRLPAPSRATVLDQFVSEAELMICDQTPDLSAEVLGQTCRVRDSNDRGPWMPGEPPSWIQD